MGAGPGGCWWDESPCSEKAAGGDYYCHEHRALSADPWDLGRVLSGGDTGRVLVERGPDSDPGIEQDKGAYT